MLIQGLLAACARTHLSRWHRAHEQDALLYLLRHRCQADQMFPAGKWNGEAGSFFKTPGSLGSTAGQKHSPRLPPPPRPACPDSPRVFAKPAPGLLPAEGQSPAAPSKLPLSACSGQRQEVPIFCQPALGDSREGQMMLMLMLVEVPVPVWVLVPVQIPVRGSGKDEVRSV